MPETETYRLTVEFTHESTGARFTRYQTVTGTSDEPYIDIIDRGVDECWDRVERERGRELGDWWSVTSIDETPID